MRNVRVRRRGGVIDLHRITIGDWFVLFAGLFTVIALFLPWFHSNLAGGHDQNAFAYSEVAAVVVIVFFLATLYLVVYPALSADVGLPPLPFQTPMLFLAMGTILLLIFTYEAGRYGCVLCQGTSRGIGVWVALTAAVLYVLGAIVKWGSRPTPRNY